MQTAEGVVPNIMINYDPCFISPHSYGRWDAEKPVDAERAGGRSGT